MIQMRMADDDRMDGFVEVRSVVEHFGKVIDQMGSFLLAKSGAN